MYIFEFVVAVAFFIVIRNQSNRLSKLEKLLQGKDVINKATVTNAVPISNEPRTALPVQPTQQVQVPVVASTSIKSETTEESYGRILGRIGIAAVLIGVAFFLKYAFDNNWIGPAGRVMVGVLFGLSFIGLGQYLRKKYLTYSDLLMGGGIAILYLSVFAAYAFYGLVGSVPAGVFMFMVTALAFAISIVNATSTLARIAIIGGFATPFLVGGGGDMMVELFVYNTILNLGVLGISMFKKWPKLLVVSFAGTAITFLTWYASYYSPNALGLTMFYVFITFLIFLAASVSRIIVTGIKSDAADYFILGANAFALSVIGYIILEPQYKNVLGYFAVLVAIVYMMVAYSANKYNPQDKTLNIFLPGLAVVFLSIAVPLQFSGLWIAVGWLVEACFLYIIASLISNRGFQVMGILVYLLGIFNVMQGMSNDYDNTRFIPVLNSEFLVSILAVIIAYVIAYIYKRFGSTSVEIQKNGIIAFVIIANIFTVATLTVEINKYYNVMTSEIDVSYQMKAESVRQYNDDSYNSPELNNLKAANMEEIDSLKNTNNTVISILWALYAALLMAIGFAKRIPGVRSLGFALFVITAIKVLVDVWSLGQLYRIISFIVFGIIALIVSFGYVKYKDRLKEII